jgi:hypothetical protein
MGTGMKKVSFLSQKTSSRSMFERWGTFTMLIAILRADRLAGLLLLRLRSHLKLPTYERTK